MDGLLKNLSRKQWIGLVTAVAGLIVVVAVVIAIAIINNYRSQYEYVNIMNYPSELPVDMRNELEVQLKRVLVLKFEAPEDSVIRGEIREETLRINDSSAENNASFIVDIDEYRQSYNIVMSWSSSAEIKNGVLISCPEQDLMKYPDMVCKAMYDNSQDLINEERYPLYSELPIIVDEYDVASRSSVHYEIRGYFNADNKLVIIINDYSGGNYEKALTEVRKRGYDTGGYEINYYNRGGDF